MKKITHVVCACTLALITLTDCSKVENVEPNFDADSVKVLVQGRWSVEKVSNKVCRDNSCNTTTIVGNPQEYFEFRADSAFLMRVSPAVNSALHVSYKASYNLGGVILLSNGSRVERFEVVELKAKNVVLQSTFTGRDPAALFTDTYYLSR